MTVFLSAFLLFQVQPLISKVILPWFGGGPAVWTTCMFFFQVALLAGYSYAHLTTKYLSQTVQYVLHIGLVVVAMVLLPIQPSAEWKPSGGETDPTWRILALLCCTVGVQFLLLATTAPLIQVWWHRMSHKAPYRLYAVSNTGSLLALVSYPFLVEPILGSRSQVLVWSAGFFVLAVLVVWSGTIAWRRATPREVVDVTADEPPPTWRSCALWLVLSGCGSVLLLAMTNHVSQNVAVVPFLWVAPLALYLLSFILAFGHPRFYHRYVFGGLMVITQIACAYLYEHDVVDNVVFLLTIHLLALFAGCMVCHGELVRFKPAARHLTLFYLLISVGGAAGGFLVSLVAPSIFLEYYEYPLVLIACWLIWIAVALRDEKGYLYRGRPVWAWGLILLTLAFFLTYLCNGVIDSAASAYMTRRSFYGVLSVQRTLSDDQQNEWVELRHGTIRHGAQFSHTENEFEPTTYYGKTSGLAYAMQHVVGKPHKRIGVLGLGIGTVAAYCEPGDYFRAYEINPDVIEIATNVKYFTFWSLFDKRGARAEMIVGDARISLERELDRRQFQNFDVLILDVFTGDAIPVHLLTREAFAIYFQHLAKDGILAVHVSNRHLKLLPVVWAMATEYGVDMAYVGIEEPLSEWVLLADLDILETIAAAHEGKKMVRVQQTEGSVMWTDDFSNIFSVLR